MAYIAGTGLVAGERKSITVNVDKITLAMIEENALQSSNYTDNELNLQKTLLSKDIGSNYDLITTVNDFVGFTSDLGTLGDKGTDLFEILKVITFLTNISITKDPIENEYVGEVNGLKYITINSSYPIPYDLVRAFHEDPVPGLDHPLMNVYARINSTELDIVVPFLVKIIDEHELRLCGTEFNNAIGYASVIERVGKWIFKYTFKPFGKKNAKNCLKHSLLFLDSHMEQ